MKFFITFVVLLQSFSISAAPLFTQAEQQWIHEHPVIWYTYPNSWPVDFHRDGQHLGLSRDYLDTLEKITGLTFRERRINVENTDWQGVDVISAVSQHFPDPEQQWLMTAPYLTLSSLVITQANEATVYSLRQLHGRRVGILKDSFFRNWIAVKHPEITLVPFNNALQSLAALDKGQLYAAIGTELTMRPLMQRYFPTTLSIGGGLSEVYTSISMAVKRNEPELITILDKAFASLTAKQTDHIFTRWTDSLKLGAPPLTTIFYYYRYEALVFGILILVLMFALHHARKARIRAQISEQDKARFLAVMSHEIRTPLNAVMASLELLQRPDVKRKEADYIDMARRSAHNLMDLLNDILDFSRLESNQMTLHKAPTDLKALLTSVRDSHQPNAVNKGLSLVLEDTVPCDDLFIDTDSQRLRQILHNLIANAIKFSARGQIRIVAEAQRLNDSDLMLLIHVIDQGPGIEKKAQARLFEAWQQVSRDEAKRAAGSGLGLYICYQLAKLLNGDLTLRSEVGQGTSVTLSMPLELTEAQTGQSELHDQSLAGFNQEISVLVVEDHELNRQLICEQLLQLGCHVEQASSCREVISLLSEENYYSLILLDCHLPDGSGYDLATEIRTDEKANSRDRTPIVAISAMSEQEHIELCYTSGMDDVLFKPIRLNALTQVLHKWSDMQACSREEASSTESLLEQSGFYLEMDLKALELAFVNQDAKHQLYYAHRIHGVALMAEHPSLAELAYELETLIRRGHVLSTEEGQAWCEKLTEQVVNLAVPQS